MAASVPNIPFVPFDLVPPQPLAQFVLEWLHGVIFLRIANVLAQGFDIRLTDREGGWFVARLSVSPNSRFFLYTADETLLAHPTRRVVSAERQKAAGKLLTLADTD